jgi:DNA-binding NarL/FixJ family response regulator
MDQLSPREVQVVKLYAVGKEAKEIAQLLDISLHTVKHHVQSIRSKTGCRNNVELAHFAIRSGLIDLLPLGAATPGPRENHNTQVRGAA